MNGKVMSKNYYLHKRCADFELEFLDNSNIHLEHLVFHLNQKGTGILKHNLLSILTHDVT